MTRLAAAPLAPAGGHPQRCHPPGGRHASPVGGSPSGGRPRQQGWYRPATWAVLALAAVGGPAWAETVFLCRSYAGQQFWSNTHCHQLRAVILRMTTVPNGTPFPQAVELGRAAMAEGERLAAPPMPARPAAALQRSTSAGAGAECAALAEHIRAIDSAARQVQSATNQDRLTLERRHARARQYRLGCS